jgi:hypothetical protein
LASYFASKEVDLGIDFSTYNEKQVDSLFAAFTALPEDQQTAIEAEFQDIHAMACDGGVAALIDEAAFHEDDSFVNGNGWKPKGVHWRTFERLRAEHDKHAGLFMARTMSRFKIKI